MVPPSLLIEDRETSAKSRRRSSSRDEVRAQRASLTNHEINTQKWVWRRMRQKILLRLLLSLQTNL